MRTWMLVWVGSMAACVDDGAMFVPADADVMRLQPPRYGGCGDMLVYGTNLAGTRAIALNANGVADAAHQAGHAIWRVTELPNPAVSLIAQKGTDLSSAWCVGVQPFPGPVVEQQWEATSGKLWVKITPDGPSPGAIADVHFRDVTFTDASTGSSFEFPPITMTDVGIGYYPP